MRAGRSGTRAGLAGTAVFAGVALIAGLIDGPTALRVVTGLPLVLLLPGYAATELVLPRSAPMGRFERLVLNVGLSIALCVVLGLVLDLLPGGLTTDSWTLALAGITLALCTTVALTRRARADARKPTRPTLSGARAAVLYGVSGAVLVGAFLIARGGAVRQEEQATFTQLWALPAHRASQPAVRIGVRSFERSTTNFRVVVRLRHRTLRIWPRITLQRGAQWEVRDPLPSLRPNGPVVVVLSRSGRSGAYRSVTAWPAHSAARIPNEMGG